jgi:hypothetical protein
MPEEPVGKQTVRLVYLPFDQVEVGMVLGEPLTLTDQHIVRFSLPAGHELTAGNLRNLSTHRAEFLCIALPEQRSEAQVAADLAAAAERVGRIFDGADLSQPVMAALFERVQAFRSR